MAKSDALQALFATAAAKRSRMQDEKVRSQRQGAFHLSAKGGDGFAVEQGVAAGEIHQIIRMDRQQLQVVALAQAAHLLALRERKFVGLPLPRAGGENLKCIAAQPVGPFGRVLDPTCGRSMNADPARCQPWRSLGMRQQLKYVFVFPRKFCHPCPILSNLARRTFRLPIASEMIPVGFMQFSPFNFDGKRFRNLVPQHHGFGSLLRWLLSRQPGPWPDWIASEPGPTPVKSSHTLRITFVNHSTFLLQFDGLNLLTDPIWSYRASPVSWTGPRRHRPPGIRFEDLPPIHAVLLSHNHYDHLDAPTLKRLAREHNPTVFTALRNAPLLNRLGMGKVIELDWWQNTALPDGSKLTAVPAQHFSGRGPFDRNRTLWCGFVIEGRSATIYFAGDTGMGPHFEQIAGRFPEIDVAILPIGAYRPEWFMGEVHTSPKDAVQAHLMLNARVSIASHFGTFRLADDGESEPTDQLQSAIAVTDLCGSDFLIMKPGEAREFPANRAARIKLPQSASDSSFTLPQ